MGFVIRFAICALFSAAAIGCSSSEVRGDGQIVEFPSTRNWASVSHGHEDQRPFDGASIIPTLAALENETVKHRTWKSSDPLELELGGRLRALNISLRISSDAAERISRWLHSEGGATWHGGTLLEFADWTASSANCSLRLAPGVLAIHARAP